MKMVLSFDKNFLVWKGYQPELIAHMRLFMYNDICTNFPNRQFYLQKWSIYYDVANGKYYKRTSWG